MIRKSAAEARVKLADILVAAGFDSKKVLRAIDYPRATGGSMQAGGSKGAIVKITSEGWRTKASYPMKSLHSAKNTDCEEASAVIAERSGPLLYSGDLPAQWKAGGKKMFPMARCNVNVTKLIKDADYIVIRYSWEDVGGRDLDTRTANLTPGASDFGQDVGWSRGEPVGDGSRKTDYLLWAGDNTLEIGEEAVRVDLKKLREDLPDAAIDFRLRAFWYGEIGTGDITVDFEVYQGQVIKDGTNFVPGAGARQLGNISFGVNISTQESADIDGEDIPIDVTAVLNQEISKSSNAYFYVAPPEPWPIPEHLKTNEPISG
ncbi:hypothetical protein [Puniceicoccus vermicola]|uniref:Uncharacterized protein n=1 Tax=Puniceicoccus vermicola TaxID=388746 RepID=A0A7X1E448_9BACT|nr:hypothetical protein [Puniceicoccus vermicola]MBC2601761.1 hypothetical protein [Puniceicoccus vermicola]